MALFLFQLVCLMYYHASIYYNRGGLYESICEVYTTFVLDQCVLIAYRKKGVSTSDFNKLILH